MVRTGQTDYRVFPARPLLLTIERGAERRAEAVRQLREEGLDYEIVDGLDGQTSLPLERKGERPMRNTELACYHSHCRAYRRMIDYGWPYALILEDDFRVLRPGRLATVLQDLPGDCDYLALHRIFDLAPGQILVPGEKFNRIKWPGLTTTSYVVSRRLARLVVEKHALPDRPIDLLLCAIQSDDDRPLCFYELEQPVIGLTGQHSLIR